MSENDNWLLDTIVAKSDQLNAVDLLGGPVTVTVQSVKKGEDDQPVVIGIGDRQPYKPCKSMRRVLIACWGANPSVWIGRQMTLFCDSAVRWGGETVGGIRISHLSHLKGASQEIQLNESKHKKTTYKVFAIATDNTERVAKAIAAITSAADIADVQRVWKLCKPLYESCGNDDQVRLEASRDAKLELLKELIQDGPS